MRLKFIAAAFAALAVVFLGCGQKQADAGKAAHPETHATAEDAAAEGTLHAGANVKPGSYEDWCSEHEVPESLCTRCNPELVAAFKATGDWCDEHGLPESQCKQCNPDLKITRPAKQEGR